MSDSDIVVALTGLAECFESLGVSYLVGGSVATSVHGIPRATLDVAVVADLPNSAVESMVSALESTFYIDGDMIRSAIATSTSFNIIHLATMLKIDVFVLKLRPFDQGAFARRRPDSLDDSAGARVFPLATPEDMIVHKLEWYRLGGEVSERQWLDVLGVLKVQGSALDLISLRRWTQELGLSDLLSRAFEETGLV